MRQIRSTTRMMKRPSTSLSCSSNADTRASFSSYGHPSPSRALSEVVGTPESNYWHVTFQPRANVGVLHSACSGASSDSRKVALIRTTTLPHPTAWHPPEHPCTTTRRSTLDRDCHRAQPFNGVARTVRLSSSTRARADLPFATIGVFHTHPNISHGAAKGHAERYPAARYGVPMRYDHR